MKVSGDANTEMKDRLIRYGLCDCYVWPMDMMTVMEKGSGRCGRCHSRVDMIKFTDRDSAIRCFDELHGKVPDPIAGQ